MEQPLVAEATPEGAFVSPWSSGMGIGQTSQIFGVICGFRNVSVVGV